MMVLIRRTSVYVLVVLFTVLVWQLLSATGSVKEFILPTPHSVLTALGNLADDQSALFDPIGQTLQHTVLASAAGAAIGVPVAIVVGSSPLLQRAYEPLFSALSCVPVVILYPVFAATLGIGASSKIVLGLLYAFFPIVIITSRAAATVDGSLIAAARSMGASRVSVMVHVTLPAIAGSLVSSMRIGLGLALVTVVAGEFIASSAGIGYQLAAASQSLDSPTLFAWVVVAIAFTALVNLAFTLSTSALMKGIKR